MPSSRRIAASSAGGLSRKVVSAAGADGPAFLNVLTDCPIGWGHEPRLSPHVVNAAVDSCYCPLYEVVDG
jgi:pyruvate ferredoxin oxidoreductase beta subunit